MFKLFIFPGKGGCSNNWMARIIRVSTVVGADSVRISNVCNYARNDQHAHAMLLLKKQCSQSAGLGYLSYIPIAQAFNKLSDADGCREGAVTGEV